MRKTTTTGKNRSRALLALVAVLALAVPGISAAASSAQRVIQVSPSGTISDAIEAAQPGDIIDVAPGVYCENVTITKPGVHLRAPLGLNRAVIDGACLGGLGHGIHVYGVADVEIIGFVIEHFEWGIHLHSATGVKIQLNEVRFIATGAATPPSGAAGPRARTPGAAFGLFPALRVSGTAPGAGDDVTMEGLDLGGAGLGEPDTRKGVRGQAPVESRGLGPDQGKGKVGKGPFKEDFCFHPLGLDRRKVQVGLPGPKASL